MLFSSITNNTDSDGNVVNPYQYVVNTENTVDKTTKLPSGGAGGNWFIDIKTGVLFFPDFNNLSSSSNNDFKISSTNKPALTIYVYVGQKGISILRHNLRALLVRLLIIMLIYH